MINCVVSLTSTWSENCVITSKTYKEAVAAQGGNPEVDIDATFQITDIKLYVPVVTLSAQVDNKLLEQLKTGFKGTIKLNKCRLEISNQTKTNNLNYLIDPTFTQINRIFVLPFENEDDRTSASNIMLQKLK